MKVVLVLAVVCLAALCHGAPAAGGQYTSKYDQMNLDEILANRRLFIPYVNCVLEQGRCTAEGKELKSHLKEALETDCAKCTENQRKGAEKVFRHLINHEPEIWEQLKAKYDPTGKYSKKHEAELRAAKA